MRAWASTLLVLLAALAVVLGVPALLWGLGLLVLAAPHPGTEVQETVQPMGVRLLAVGLVCAVVAVTSMVAAVRIRIPPSLRAGRRSLPPAGDGGDDPARHAD